MLRVYVMKDYHELIDKLNLIAHPEGGYYRRNWQSLFTGDLVDSNKKLVFPTRTIGSSSIYMLPSAEVSAWHRLNCDEMWHHYSGSPLRIYILTSHKGLESHILGSDILAGQNPQIIVHRHSWAAAEVIEADSFSLCGCTLWPAFSYTDFELADPDKLMDEFPLHKDVILRIAKRVK